MQAALFCRDSNGGFMNARVFSAVTAALALTFFTACKLNKDGNCLNPKAGCFVKDTEAPRVASTTPASTPSAATRATIVVRTDVTIYFSEPMLNAEDLSSYPNPIGTGCTLQITGVTKINDTTYRLNISSGEVGTGLITFDLSALRDLSGNAISPNTFQIQAGAIAANPPGVSSTGYLETNITWGNETPDTMNYLVKIGGTDCGTAVNATGTNVSGTVLSGGAVITNLGFSQFSAGSNTVRVCMTPVSTGTDTPLSVTVTRDDIAPTTNDLTFTNGRCQIPYAITLTCNDNVDRIIYTIDGTNPAFNIQTTGGAVGATPQGTSQVYSIGSGYTLQLRGSTNFRYLCVDTAGHLNSSGVAGVKSATCQSKMVWGETNWSAAGPTQPYDVWD